MTIAASMSAPARQLCLLVADSNRMSSQLLADALKRDHRIEVVCAAASFSEALAAVANEKVDVALVSAEVDRESHKGFLLSGELRKIRPSLQIVMLLESSRRDLILEAFRAGASGVFCRTHSVGLLAKCIQGVHGGQIWANSRELDYVITALAESAPIRTFNPKAAALLSRREQEVVHNVGAGLTNHEIAERLGLSDHTVKNYLFRIFEKLGISSRVELVLHALTQDFENAKYVVPETASAQPAILGRRALKRPIHSQILPPVAGSRMATKTGNLERS